MSPNTIIHTAVDVAAVEALLVRQKADWRAQGGLDYARRRALLRGLDDALARRQDELTAAMSQDFGNRHLRESEIYELYPLRAELRYVLRHLKGWMRPRRAHVRWPFLPSSGWVVPQPRGVVGVIGAWNYPLLLTVLPIISAIAAGNRVIVKAPRLAPHSMALLAEIFAALAPSEILALVQPSPAVDAAFPGLPFNHLVFSGSTRTGRSVARMAARNLTPVTLSLSGKSPAIVAPGYDPAAAARAIVAGKLVNAGQTCIAPDYCLVPAVSLEAFVAAAKAAVHNLYPQGLHDPGYTHVPEPSLRTRLDELVADAEAKGAQSWWSGPAPEAGFGAAPFPPVLLWDVHPGMACMEDEIFGPVLPIVAYEHLAEAADFVRDRPAPLALYWFDIDQPRARRETAKIPAGGVGINAVLVHAAQPELPFGGIGESGIGQYRGRYGFQRLSHMQGVYRNASRATGWVQPPYGGFARRLMALLLRWG
ncbi:MAG: aldehyde dehydrogenase family protein [Acidocella sp.]|nr:aldehyde dehydrogenase family protein [Acidocella sp.]